MSIELNNSPEEIIAAAELEARELGYESFSKAWVDRMSDITVSAELRPYVVYKLLDEGMNQLDIALAVKGYGPDSVRALSEEKARGVPASHARTRLRHE